MANYETVIGLEVHSELLTSTKIFCGCSTSFGDEPNSNVCPICLGMPGTLPVLNNRALELAAKAGLSLNCEIADFSKFDRKNYFYPDLPKAYQISQFDLPIAKNGYLDVTVNGEKKRIRINRIHMEEDAGKLVHSERGGGSLVDFNRTGVPLIEIVTEPDIGSPEEAKAFLEGLKAILQYTDVSDCKMEEGSLRCDANVSLRPVGSTEFGTKTEVKNMNSFRAVERALNYEVERQAEALEDGEEIIQETRRWDEDRGITISMRSKEEAHDYRYFPDPDLVPVVMKEEQIEKVRQEIPELPNDKKERFIKDFNLSEYDASVITADKSLAEFFDECVKTYDEPKKIANWIMGEISRVLNEDQIGIEDTNISPERLTELLKLEDEGTISNKIAKEVFEDMYQNDKSPKQIVEEKGLVQISDTSELEGIIDQVISENPSAVEDYRGGKKKAMGFLVGQVMKKTKGKANPQKVNELLQEKLEN
ncbi:Asp-tRNA(Asn)/Glu-tRNA(Gln) amidotransferase subunit GatB [Natranaerobius thermophilus]|uniref:Aspartyl/glutamyl-tRNA(Asn/Gln) amidotransferase subunit B n=1 Tax=Natranaerobius thermophilus (strain ATCC BAA-1301 / DSM 18059 / JW/NM-WN-LF) TaxID=457570 RepID=B2A5W8_NATTJ|nr:Asp-tRNA(Asn)/Glu-tRNA(Gln) amidotransferase subunit GatB [Natranaerobius thermophilus]ACB84061.1 aspartyl/glutamyl-tRNA(Asn/Gln) amidotransferase subunit B [Natranaerobius thermophilus JW/NM-WN-LF]